MEEQDEKQARIESLVSQYVRYVDQCIADPIVEVDVEEEEKKVPLVVSDRVGVVVVTSALQIHPETTVLEAVLSTHQKLEPELRDTLKVVVCDCAKRVPEKKKTQWKQGRISEEEAERYNEYICRLEQLAKEGKFPFENVRIFRMPSYGGFGKCLQQGLSELVACKGSISHALVLQHDRILKETFGLKSLLRTMLRRPNQIRYIGLASNSSRNSIIRYRSMGIRVEPWSIYIDTRDDDPQYWKVREEPPKKKSNVDSERDDDDDGSSLCTNDDNNNTKTEESDDEDGQKKEKKEEHHLCGRRLVALPFWYDSTHLASIDHYLNFVYGWHAMPGTQYEKPFRLKTGDFPEDKLGNAMLAHIRAKGMKVHRVYGCYLLDDAKTVYVRHVHGRKLGTGYSRAVDKYISSKDIELDESDDEE